MPRYDSAPIPLVDLGNGTVTIIMTVSSPSHVEVEPHVFPSFSGVVSPETGLSESGSIPCAQTERVVAPPPGVVGVFHRRDR